MLNQAFFLFFILTAITCCIDIEFPNALVPWKIRPPKVKPYLILVFALLSAFLFRPALRGFTARIL